MSQKPDPENLLGTALHQGARISAPATAPPPRHHATTTLFALATTLAALATTLPLCAQSASTGGLRGRVVDQEGAPVEAALVTLVHTRTGATSTVFSVVDGRYSLRGQRPGGPYRVTVARIGIP